MSTCWATKIAHNQLLGSTKTEAQPSRQQGLPVLPFTSHDGTLENASWHQPIVPAFTQCHRTGQAAHLFTNGSTSIRLNPDLPVPQYMPGMHAGYAGLPSSSERTWTYGESFSQMTGSCGSELASMARFRQDPRAEATSGLTAFPICLYLDSRDGEAVQEAKVDLSAWPILC